jgi:hypothetical protein
MLVRRRRRIALEDVEAAHRSIQAAERLQSGKAGYAQPLTRAQQVIEALQVNLQRGRTEGRKAQPQTGERQPADGDAENS